MRLIAPSSGTPVRAGHIISALWTIATAQDDFGAAVKRFTGRRHCFFASSGTAAFYLILEALKTVSGRKEVLMPAYTAPSLILPILKSGLKVRLCDVSLDTFNIDIDEAASAAGPETLAIMPVHMFGIPCDMGRLRKIAQGCGAFLIEDAASSVGSQLDGKPTGSLGDVGFFSFNRGKNLSTLCGGCILTDDDALAELIEAELNDLPDSGLWDNLLAALKVVALALAVRPLVYTIFYKIIEKYKYTALHEGFQTAKLTRFQAAIGSVLFKRAEGLFEKRRSNGEFLRQSLGRIKGIKTPYIPPDSRPVYNQFPILLGDQRSRDIVAQALAQGGIEATTLYPEPMHRAYDLGFDLNHDPFPQSTCLARRLLLIPTHPMMGHRRLQRAVGILAASLGDKNGSEKEPVQDV